MSRTPRSLREIPSTLVHEIRPKVQVSRPLELFAHPRHTAPAVEAPAFAPGTAVRHPTFGTGTGIVTDAEGSGAHPHVQVNFDEAGNKWLVAAFANLQKV